MSASDRGLFQAVVISTALLGGAACSKKMPPPAPPAFTAYSFCLEGAADLNWYDRQAHTVFVRIFRLGTPDGFLGASREALLGPQVSINGIEGTPIEVTMHPGQKKTVDVPLTSPARNLGVLVMFNDESGRDRVVREMTPTAAGTIQCLKLGRSAIEAS